MEENMFSINENKYTQMTDEKLIENVNKNDQTALNCLIGRYNDVVNMKANKFFMVGAEREDMVQEGMIGLYKAIRSFEVEKHSAFKSFANMCVERQMITAIKTSNRQKHMPLNSYLSLNSSPNDEDDEDGADLLDIFNANLVEDPLETVTKKEYYSYVEKTINNSLSDFEKKVLNRFINGESYEQIASKLETPVKSVDNAIQRIRKKAIKNIIDIEDNK